MSKIKMNDEILKMISGGNVIDGNLSGDDKAQIDYNARVFKQNGCSLERALQMYRVMNYSQEAIDYLIFCWNKY